MSPRKKTPPSDETRPDFDWQINILFEVLGATHPAAHLTNTQLARFLDVGLSGVTQRRRGTTALRLGDAAKIVAGYGLTAYDLDHSLFEIRDREAFKATLKAHGVGIYEENPRRLLVQMLEERAATGGLSVSVRRARGTRGIGFAAGAEPLPALFHPGEAIEIVVQAGPGRHVALLQYMLDMTHAIEVLSPSAGIPLIEVSERQFRLPGPGTEPLQARRPAGPYRLMVVETDLPLAALFGGAEPGAPEGAPPPLALPRMTDATARQLVQRLKRPGAPELRTATTDFIIS